MAGMTKYRFEMASRSDWPEISRLQEQWFADDPTRLYRGEFESLAGGVHGKVIAARFGLKIVAYIVMRRRRFLPWECVAFVAVDPEHRGQGLASELTAAVSEVSPRLFLRLHVRSTNHPALAVYRKLGFIAVKRKRQHYADGEDALVMMRWNGFTFWRVSLPAGIGSFSNPARVAD